MPTKKSILITINPNVAKWALTAFGKDRRSAAIESLLAAVRDRRLVVLPHPAPEEPTDGRNWPAVVCLDPE